MYKIIFKKFYWAIITFILFSCSTGRSVQSGSREAEMLSEFHQLQKELKILFYQKNYQKEEKVLLKSLELSLKLFGEKHGYTAITYYSLGAVYKGMGLHEKSNKYLLKSIDIFYAIYSETKKEKEAVIKSFLSANYYYLLDNLVFMRKLKSALLYTGQGSKYVEDLNFGVESKLRFMKMIAFIYSQNKKYSKSVYYYKKTFDFAKGIYVKENEEMLSLYNIYAQSLIDAEKLDEAHKLYKKALSVLMQVNDKEKIKYKVIFLNNLATLEYRKKNYYLAEKYCRTGVELYERKIGIKNERYLNYLFELVKYSRLIKKKKQWVETAKKIIQVAKDQKIENESVAEANYNLGIYYDEQKDYKQALPYYLKAIDVYEKNINKDYMSYIRVSTYLFDIYIELGDERKNTIIQESLEKLSHHFGNNKKIMKDVYSLLADYYKDRKYKSLERKARKALIDIQKWD